MKVACATPYRKQGQRVWTDAQRAEQGRKLQQLQIWLKSTGPRTLEGKAISSRNARHPDYEQRREERAELRHMRVYLRAQKTFVDLLNLFTKQRDSMSEHRYYAMAYRLFFLENELIDLERQMLGGFLFYDIIKRKEQGRRGNIIPFPDPLT